MRLVFSWVVMALLLASCGGSSRADAEPEGVRIVRDWTFVPHGGGDPDGHAALQLDLYLPETHDRPLPIVMWLHGGGWLSGSRERCPVAYLAQHGYAVASVSYRLSTLSSPVAFPAQLHDCKAAVRWLRHSAWRFGCDGGRIAVVGLSAGGHLAALLGTTGDEAELAGGLGETGPSSRVQAVVSLCAPSDLLALEASDPDHWRMRLVALGLLDGRPSERPRLARLASPAAHADGDSAPFLLFHGRDDGMVPIAQSERLHAALSGAGATSTLVAFDHLPHSDAALRQPEVRERMRTFLDTVLKPEPVTVRRHRPGTTIAHGSGVPCRSPFLHQPPISEELCPGGPSLALPRSEAGDLGRIVGRTLGDLHDGDMDLGGEEFLQIGLQVRMVLPRHLRRFDHQ